MARGSTPLVAFEAAKGNRFFGILKYFVLGFLAQGLVDLFLDRRAFLAPEPLFPVVDCLPGADHEILFGVVGAAKRLTGDVARLTARERPELRDEIQKSRFLFLRDFSFDKHFYEHVHA